MQQDGNAQTERELLVRKLQRHLATLEHLSPIEDASLITQCEEIIRTTKEQLILLHSPQDQLRNVQAAIARNQGLATALSSKICNFQRQETHLKDKIAEMMLREQQLQEICKSQVQLVASPETPEDADGRPSNEQFMQLQAQLSALHSQYSADHAAWKQQIHMLALVPNLPEDAVKLLPVIANEVLAAPPTPTGLQVPSDDEQDLSPPADALLNGFETFNDRDDDDMYGPRAPPSSSSLRSRSAPYAGSSEPFLEEEAQTQTSG